MKFYSGFSLKNDKQLFTEFIKKSEFNVAGFSYGAIKAFEYVSTCRNRVDILQLFSPAFFQDKPSKFKRMQKMYFQKDKTAYLKDFLTSCELNENVKLVDGTIEDLDTLLNYEWKKDELQALKDRGIKIEVYLGIDDKIINSLKTKEFFLPFADVYTLNNAGHGLQIKNQGN